MPRRNYPHKPSKPRMFSVGGSSDCQNKARYQSKQQAEAVAADQEAMNLGLELKVYQCPHCGGWHLTRQKVQ